MSQLKARKLLAYFFLLFAAAALKGPDSFPESPFTDVQHLTHPIEASWGGLRRKKPSQGIILPDRPIFLGGLFGAHEIAHGLNQNGRSQVVGGLPREFFAYRGLNVDFAAKGHCFYTIIYFLYENVFKFSVPVCQTIMTFVICEPCIGTKDTSCVDACPVDCIHPRADEEPFEKETLIYIDPEECIDCGACVPECPVEAIFPEEEVPEHWQHYTDINAQWFLQTDGSN